MFRVPQHSSASIPSRALQDCGWRVRDGCLTNLSQRKAKRFKNAHLKWRLNVGMRVQREGSGNGTPHEDGVHKCRLTHVVSVKWHEWNCRAQSTGIVDILQTERSGIRFPAGRRACNLPCPDRFCSDGYWGLLSGGKAVEVPPSSAAVKNEWSCTSGQVRCSGTLSVYQQRNVWQWRLLQTRFVITEVMHHHVVVFGLEE
jgi:hypothetical protein